jgi:hypothetical protein
MPDCSETRLQPGSLSTQLARRLFLVFAQCPDDLESVRRRIRAADWPTLQQESFSLLGPGWTPRLKMAALMRRSLGARLFRPFALEFFLLTILNEEISISYKLSRAANSL